VSSDARGHALRHQPRLRHAPVTLRPGELLSTNENDRPGARFAAGSVDDRWPSPDLDPDSGVSSPLPDELVSLGGFLRVCPSASPAADYRQRAAHAVDVGPERLGDLHRERPNASRRTDDSARRTAERTTPLARETPTWNEQRERWCCESTRRRTRSRWSVPRRWREAGS
jgi:hypothetical protein